MMVESSNSHTNHNKSDCNLLDFLITPRRVAHMSSTELMVEQGRMIVLIICQISAAFNKPDYDVYNLLSESNTIQYMIDNYNILHTFDLRNAAEHVLEHAKNHGDESLWM